MLDSKTGHKDERWRRSTRPRRQVIEILSSASAPMTAQQVSEAARTSLPSTYRILGSLVKRGLASEIEGPSDADSGRVRLYSFCSSEEHHHHFVCHVCNSVVDVSSEALERALAQLEQSTGLLIEEHEVLLRGRCDRCRISGENS